MSTEFNYSIIRSICNRSNLGKNSLELIHDPPFFFIGKKFCQPDDADVNRSADRNRKNQTKPIDRKKVEQIIFSDSAEHCREADDADYLEPHLAQNFSENSFFDQTDR